jgi:hypothetical protein
MRALVQCFAFQCVMAVSVQGGTPRPEPFVGALGEAACLKVEGAASLGARNVEKQLSQSAIVALASHPRRPLADYLGVLKEAVQNHYLGFGFAEVKVTAEPNVDKNQILIRIVEGPQTFCGEIDATQLPADMAAEIVQRLTEPTPAVSAIAVVSTRHEQTRCIRWINRNGTAATVEEPLWKRGEPTAFNREACNKLEALVRNVCNEHGYFNANFAIEIRNDGTPQRNLRIKVDSLGRQMTVGEVEIRGHVKNQDSEIIAAAQIALGEPLDRRLCERVYNTLRQSARFSKILVDVRLPGKGERGKLAIEVAEIPFLPSLSEPLNEVAQSLMKLGNYLENFDPNDGDLVFTLTRNQDQGLLRFVISPNANYLLQCDMPQSAAEAALNGWLFLCNKGCGIAFSGERRKYTFQPKVDNASGYFHLNLDDTGERVNFGVGVTSKGCQVDWMPLICEPVVLAALAYRDRIQLDRIDDLCRFTRDQFTLEFHATTGKLYRAMVATDQGVLECRMITGEFARLYSRYEEETRSHTNDYDARKPISSATKFLLAETPSRRLLLSLLAKQYESFRDVQATDRMANAMYRFVNAGALDTFDDWMTSKAIPQGKHQSTDNTWQGISRSTQDWQTWIAMAAFLKMNQIDELAPRDSAIWSAARLTAVCVSPVPEHYATEKRLFDESRAIIGDETVMEAVQVWMGYASRLENPATSIAWIDEQLPRLSLANFQRDLQEVFRSPRPVAKEVLRVAELVRGLREEDVETLATVLPPTARDLVMTISHSLHEHADAPIELALSRTLDRLWTDRWSGATRDCLLLQRAEYEKLVDIPKSYPSTGKEETKLDAEPRTANLEPYPSTDRGAIRDTEPADIPEKYPSTELEEVPLNKE